MPHVCNAWVWLANHNDQYLQSKYASVNEQQELILTANWNALQHIKQSAKKIAFNVGGSTLDIPNGSLLLLWDHTKGSYKLKIKKTKKHIIKNNYKSE